MRGLLVLALLVATVAPARADDVAQANKLCSLFDATKMLAEPCRVTDGRVTISIEDSSDHAREFCSGMLPKIEKKMGLSFEKPWSFYVTSPFSDGHSIAYCAL